MKKILFLTIFLALSGSIYGQNNQEEGLEGKTEIAKLYVKMVAISLPTAEKNLLDKELILLLSRTKPLIDMNLTTNENRAELKIKFAFNSMKSFFEWYEKEEIKELFEKIREKFKYSLDINFMKTAL